MKLGVPYLNGTLFMTIVIVVLITSSSIFMSEAKAAPTVLIKGVFVNGAGPIGGGATGTLTCPDGTDVSVENQIFVTVSKGRHTGGMTTASLEDTTRTETMQALDNVQISSNRFSFSGILEGGIPGNPEFHSMCGDSYYPTKASVSGRCGEGVTITMEATNGEHGIFLGDVFCTTERF